MQHLHSTSFRWAGRRPEHFRSQRNRTGPSTHRLICDAVAKRSRGEHRGGPASADRERQSFPDPARGLQPRVIRPKTSTTLRNRTGIATARTGAGASQRARQSPRRGLEASPEAADAPRRWAQGTGSRAAEP